MMPGKAEYVSADFPLNGLDLSQGYGMQPAGTTRVGTNVRFYDPRNNRGRGASRQGLSPIPAGQIPQGTHLIQDLNVVAWASVDALEGGCCTLWDSDLDPVDLSGIDPLYLPMFELPDVHSPDAYPVVTDPTTGRQIREGGTGAQPIHDGRTVPTVTWDDPADIVVGFALTTTELDATASVAGTFVYTPPLGTVLPVGEDWPLGVVFTPTDPTICCVSDQVHIDVIDEFDATGTAAMTLGAMTMAATGSVGVSGTAAMTLGAMTMSASGTMGQVTGTSAMSLGAMTMSATGAVGVSGTSAMTLGAMTMAATGTATGANVQVFYPLLETAADVGSSTLPSTYLFATYEQSDGTYAGSNAKKLSVTAGSAQQSANKSDWSSTSSPATYGIAQFLSAPLAGQVLGSSTATIGIALKLSNADADHTWQGKVVIYLVNGSTGAIRTNLTTALLGLGTASRTSTGELTCYSAAVTQAGATITAGDYLAFEMSLTMTPGVHGGALTANTTGYTSGTTAISADAASTSDAKSFIDLGTPVTLA